MGLARRLDWRVVGRVLIQIPTEAFMAVRTLFTDHDLVDILSKYKLGAYIRSEPVTQGTVQTNYFVYTTQRKLVFRYYENRSADSVLFEVSLVKYLRNAKYPCPAPFRNTHGKCVGILDGKPYVIFEFVQGEHIETPSENQKRQLIQRVAELQNISRNYRPLHKRHRWNYSVHLCRKLAGDKAKKIDTMNAREKLKWLKIELSKLDIPESLPKGICHCDFHFSNVLCRRGQFSALIDFDDANYTYLLFDLVGLIEPFKPAFAWNTWHKFRTADDVIDLKETRKVVHEYMKCRQLNNSEKMHLFDVCKLSILFDCVWYFGRGNAMNFYEKRKIDYLDAVGRERFHNEVFW
jgi:Ser/Thr protein kinase RdoA (MazF antagonist)